MQIVDNKNAGTIKVKIGKNPKQLYLHQSDAMKKLNEKVNEKNKFAGLIVIPTGGGKTLTAVQWVLKNIIDKDKKVLWIAHRHELLNQALQAVISNSYSDILKNKKGFKFRIISGMHDKPVHIEENDDFIIASKDSLNHGMNHLINKWVSKNLNNIFLVIDEAHHSTAKSYRNIIKELENKNDSWFKMLGLTATPFRTSESEKGLLKTVFQDDIAYDIDLKTLINRKILADPVFIELNTKIDMTNELTDKDIKSIQAFDNLPGDIAQQIAMSKERNNKIVNHYIENKDKYRQTLVFAVSVVHAIELSALFNKYNIASDFVVSSIKDMYTGVTISNEENLEKLQKFREGKIKVLVNVNILTEGTDLPSVQSIFLTRPTTSTILMTQMIGRALRGKNAGGTDEAYIVSFIDNWKDKISWVSPKRLFDGEPGDPKDPKERARSAARLIAISKIEEITRIMDDTIDTDAVEKLDFIERVPVGAYSFSILIPSKDGEPDEKNCDILVYDSFKQAYEDFINDLDYIFKEKKVEEKEFLDDYELDYLCNFIEKQYFEGYDTTISYKDEDIKDVLRYYAQKEAKLTLLNFEEREKFDISRIAEYIWNEDMGAKTQAKYIESLWNDDEGFWKLFFGNNKKYFTNQINLELYKISGNEDSKEDDGAPEVIKEKIELSKLSLNEIRKSNPKYWRRIVNTVYEKSRDGGGYYHSAISDYKSKSKREFQIDHIKPMSKGGLTELDNLQVITTYENMIKGDSYPYEFGKSSLTKEVALTKDETVENTLSTETNALNEDTLIDELIGQEEYEKALSLIEERIASRPDIKEGYYKAAEILEELNKADEAEEYLQKALAIDPDYADALNLYGNIFSDKKELDKALEYYDKAIKAAPNFECAYYNKGATLQDMSQVDKALVYYDKAIELNEKYEYPHIQKALILFYDKNKIKSAMTHINKAVEINSENDYAYLCKGDILKDSEKYEKALKCYEKAIELNQDNACAHNGRGFCLRELKRYAEVLAEYTRAIELEPNFQNAYFNMAYELERKRRYKEAIKYYKKAAELDPTDLWAFNNMGYTYFKMKEYDKALECYNKAREISPNEKIVIANINNALKARNS